MPRMLRRLQEFFEFHPSCGNRINRSAARRLQIYYLNLFDRMVRPNENGVPAEEHHLNKGHRAASFHPSGIKALSAKWRGASYFGWTVQNHSTRTRLHPRSHIDSTLSGLRLL